MTERNVHPGALVGPTGERVPVFRLEQNSRLRLVAAVPEVDASGIARGSHVTFTVPAWPEQSFSGVVAGGAFHGPQNPLHGVELDAADPRGVLAPGMQRTVNWPVRRARPVLMVPASAVVTTAERTFVCAARPEPGSPRGPARRENIVNLIDICQIL